MMYIHAFRIPFGSFNYILLLVVSVCLPKRSKHGTRAALKDLNIGPKVVEESFRQDLSKICPKTLRVFTPPTSLCCYHPGSLSFTFKGKKQMLAPEFDKLLAADCFSI